MKKVKYLIWCLILWLWLLVNQSFWNDVSVDLVSSWSQYLLTFPEVWWCTNSYWCSSAHSYMYYNIDYKYWYSPIILSYWSQNYCWSSNCPVYQFNNSIFTFSWYSSSTYWYTSNERYPINFNIYNTSLDFSWLPQFVIWNWDQLGNVFFCYDCFNVLLEQNPKFKIWLSYITSDSYTVIWSDISSYFRFFNTTSNFDVSSVNFISWSWFPLDHWQYFNPYRVFTDYWQISNRGLGFSYISSPSYFWYSTVYSLDQQDTWSVSFKEFKFRTIYDLVSIPLQLLSANNKYLLNADDLSWFSFDWVLVLPANSYLSWKNTTEYLISLDKLDFHRVLYEKYTCNTFLNSVEYILSWSSTCSKVDAWYLTYNWSTDVLPFNYYDSKLSLNTVSDSWSPLLSDLTENFRLSTSTTSQWFQIWNHIYWFQSDESVSILAQWFLSYNNSSLWDFNSIEYNCLNNYQFYSYNMDLCNSFTDWNNPWTIINVSWSNYTVETVCTWDSYFSSWTICIQRLVPVDFSWSVYVDPLNWQTYYIAQNTDETLMTTENWVYYISWFLDEDWLLTWSYFSDYFNSDRVLFSCPFPEVSVLPAITKKKIWNFYPFMPLNCFISAYKAWSAVHYFDEFGLDYENFHILYWDSKYHKILYRFFDLLLSLWLFLLLSSLIRLFKH